MQAPKPGAGWNKFKIYNRDTVEYLPGHPRYKKRGPGTNASIGEDLAVKMARARKARLREADIGRAAGPGMSAPGRVPQRPSPGGGPDRPPAPRVRPPRPPRPPMPPRRRRPPTDGTIIESQ